MENVGEYMTALIPSVDHEATIREVAEFMKSKKTASVLVEKEGNYIGIVTDADFTRKVAREDLPVNTSKIEDIMSSPIVTMDQSASMTEANELMLHSQIRHLAITDAGKIIGMLSIVDFLNYHKEIEKKLKQLSVRDGLTGIFNRRYFDEIIAKEWKRAAREKFSISLIMLDIDSFKLYNDFYGHQAGDECLKNISAAIANSLNRPADVAARYGGEEFVVILPNVDKSKALQLAETCMSSKECVPK
jgi:GGDEF domain-containing protein/CBS domain-containing protein